MWRYGRVMTVYATNIKNNSFGHVIIVIYLITADNFSLFVLHFVSIDTISC